MRLVLLRSVSPLKRVAAVVFAGLALVAVGCGDGSGTATTVAPTTTAPTTTAPTTTAPTTATSSTVPELTSQEQARFQARAMARAWQEQGSPAPVCVSAEASAELRAALADLFPAEIEYFEPGEGLWDPDGSGWRCVQVVVDFGPVVQLRPDVVAVNAGVLVGPLAGSGGDYLFRWDGAAWVDATAEEVGVTVTTWVS